MTSTRVISLSILNGLLGVFGTVLNTTVVFVIFKNKDLRKGLNLFILSLSLADLLSNVLAQPIYIYLLAHGTESDLHNLIKVFHFFAFVSLHASTNNLAAITLYRLRALSRLFRHLILISRKQTWCAIVSVWSAAVTMAVFFDIEPGKSAAPYIHLLVILAWIGSYAGIYGLVRQHKQRISSKEGMVSCPFMMANLKYESEAAKTSAILVGTSVICFFPDVVYELLGVAEKTRLQWAYTLLFANAVINPCVFVCRSQQFRRAFRKTCRCVWDGPLGNGSLSLQENLCLINSFRRGPK